MPMPGCYCFGGNTPDLERYCCCQGIGDKDHYDRCQAAMEPHLDLGNAAYAAGDELAAYGHVDAALTACRAVPVSCETSGKAATES